MARGFLWFYIFIGFMYVMISAWVQKPIGMYPKIVVVALLSVLAICDAIEKRK
jgi:hypothetical protein